MSIPPPKITTDEPSTSPTQLYGPYNAMFITMKVYHGGYFLGNEKNIYINGKVSHILGVNIHSLTSQKLQAFAKKIGIEGNTTWFNQIEGESLECGLIPLHSESEVDRYKTKVFPTLCNTVQVMYIDQAPSTVRSYWPEALWEGERNNLFPHMLACFRSNPNVTFDEACNQLWKQFDLVPTPFGKLLDAWEKTGFFFEEFQYDLPFWDMGEW